MPVAAAYSAPPQLKREFSLLANLGPPAEVIATSQVHSSYLARARISDALNVIQTILLPVNLSRRTSTRQGRLRVSPLGAHLSHKLPLCPQLARADISTKGADSRFDVVDGARSRRRIAVR